MDYHILLRWQWLFTPWLVTCLILTAEKIKNGAIIERKDLATIKEEVTWLWLTKRFILFYKVNLQSKFV